MFPKINNIGFGARGHVRKSRNHRNEKVEGSPISKAKSYKFELKQTNIMELLKIPFQEISHKNNPKLENYKKNADLSFFPGFL